MASHAPYAAPHAARYRRSGLHFQPARTLHQVGLRSSRVLHFFFFFLYHPLPRVARITKTVAVGHVVCHVIHDLPPMIIDYVILRFSSSKELFHRDMLPTIWQLFYIIRTTNRSGIFSIGTSNSDTVR